MKKGLKLPFAVRGEALVHISEVTSGRQPDCLCPGCGEQLIARKGIKLAHHFAHDGGTNCSVETALHMLGKRLIHEGIQRALTGGTAIKLRWECNQCPDEHEGNLLKRAATVKLEHDLGEARPDVLLLDALGKPVVAIEIVVTHAPEEAVREFYARQHIQLVRINLPDGAALEPLRDLSQLSASFVSVCTRKKCPSCRRPLTKRQLHIIAADCYRCHKPMRVGFVNAEGNAINPPEFTAKDVQLATSEGCFLENRFSDTRNRSYLANVCKTCKAFIGEHHMTNYWNETPVAVLPAGFCCRGCKREFPETDS